MNEIVQVTNTGSSRAVATTFKNELEVQEHFTRIINNKVLMRKFAFVGGSLLGLALLWPIIQAAMFAGCAPLRVRYGMSSGGGWCVFTALGAM